MRTTPVENKERNKRRRAVNQSYLKAMDKNTHNHAARNAGRILKYGASGFRRNIWLSIAATLVMTITLLILCATAFASSVLSSTAQSMREKIDIAIYFKPGTDAETLEELKTIMAADSNVRNVTVSTSEAEYDNLVAQNDNEELQTALADEDMKEQLITAMQAAMRVQVYDTENLDSIKNIVNNNELFVVNLDPDNVPTYDSNREQIQTITNWANIAKNGGLILQTVPVEPGSRYYVGVEIKNDDRKDNAKLTVQWIAKATGKWDAWRNPAQAFFPRGRGEDGWARYGEVLDVPDGVTHIGIILSTGMKSGAAPLPECRFRNVKLLRIF